VLDLNDSVKKKVANVFKELESTKDSERIQKLEKLRNLANSGLIGTIKIQDIETSDNIRKRIDEDSDAFRGLVESIRKYGVLENAVAELHVDSAGEDFKLLCLAGHRRILAAQQAGLEKIPCLIKHPEDDGHRVGAALSENLNREDLHAFDIGDAYATLTKNNWSIEDIAKFYGRDVRTVQHYLKLSTWPEDVKDLARQHPAIFSTRVLMREFAYKAFASDDELREKIKSKIEKAKATSHVSERRVKMKERVDSYFANKKDVSSQTKREVMEILKFLKLL